MDNFQRKDSKSNAHVGREFENDIKQYFQSIGTSLTNNYPLEIGFGKDKKSHKFDLGSENPAILIECKSHKWTVGDNIPSAKLTVWNEVMLYFLLAPDNYQKILFTLFDYSQKRSASLAEYYIRTYSHLIPKAVEIWEFDEARSTANRVY